MHTMRKIKTLEDCSDYKYLIGLTPEDARVLKTSLSYLPEHATNQPEMKTLIKAVDDVATVKNDISNILSPNPNCDVCED